MPRRLILHTRWIPLLVAVTCSTGIAGAQGRPSLDQDLALAETLVKKGAAVRVELDAVLRRAAPQAAAGGSEVQVRYYRALYRLAQFEAGANLPAPAFAHFNQVVLFHRSRGDAFNEAIVLHNVAVQHWTLGDSTRALQLLEQVRTLRIKIKDTLGLAYTQQAMANCYWSMGQLPRALEAYREALRLYQELNNERGIADARNAAGLVLAYLGDTRESRKELDLSLELFRKLKQPAGEAYALNNLGLLQNSLQQPREALESLKPALNALEAAHDQRGIAYVLQNLGNAYALMGPENAVAASDAMQRSLRMKREIQDRWGEAYTLQTLGELAFSQNDLTAARHLLEQSLALRREVRDQLGMSVTLAALARVDERERANSTAVARMREAIGILESMRSQLFSEDLRLNYFSSRRDFYAYLIHLLVKNGHTGEAFTLAEQSSARLLSDQLHESLAQVRQGVSPQLKRDQEQLSAAIQSAHDRLKRYYSAPRDPAQQRLLEDRIRALLARRRVLDERMRRESPSYAALISPAQIPLRTAQAMLPVDAVYLRFFCGRDVCYRFAVTTSDVKVETLPPAKTIADQVEAFRAHLAPETLAPLSAALLVGLPRRLAQRLLISPDAALELVPFAALTAPGETEPLAARHAITMVPSLSVIRLARQRLERSVPPRRWQALVVSEPAYTDRPPLPFSREEASAIARALPAAHRVSATGRNASRALLEQSDLRRYDLLHLAVHAEVSPLDPSLTALLMSDGAISLPEIFNLSLRARLVVLSACRTATGETLAGEGMSSLARAFLYAGSTSIVASLWDIEDRSAAEFMQRFYSNLFAGKASPAEAVRAAEEEMRRASTWRDVRHWAAFVHYGDWQ